jgi:hypothetical protein
VFCNYILDVLPATVLRNGTQGPEELQIRTHLTSDRQLLAQYTKLTPDQIRELARGDAAEKAGLIPLISLLEFETAFVPVTELPPQSTAILTYGKDLERVVLNHGAIQCLSACSELLGAAGFLLWNDYGSVQQDQIAVERPPGTFRPRTSQVPGQMTVPRQQGTSPRRQAGIRQRQPVRRALAVPHSPTGTAPERRKKVVQIRSFSMKYSQVT